MGVAEFWEWIALAKLDDEDAARAAARAEGAGR